MATPHSANARKPSYALLPLRSEPSTARRIWPGRLFNAVYCLFDPENRISADLHLCPGCPPFRCCGGPHTRRTKKGHAFVGGARRISAIMSCLVVLYRHSNRRLSAGKPSPMDDTSKPPSVGVPYFVRRATSFERPFSAATGFAQKLWTILSTLRLPTVPSWMTYFQKVSVHSFKFFMNDALRSSIFPSRCCLPNWKSEKGYFLVKVIRSSARNITPLSSSSMITVCKKADHFISCNSEEYPFIHDPFLIMQS